MAYLNCKNRHVAAWRNKVLAKGVPLCVVMFAEVAAYGSESWFELRSLIFSGKFPWPQTEISDEEWFECYHNSHSTAWRAFKTAFSSGFFKKLLQVTRLLEPGLRRFRSWWYRLTETARHGVIREVYAREISDGWLTNLESDAREFQRTWIANHDRCFTDDLVDVDPDSVFETPVVQFFLRVWMPCVQEYGQTPDVLFRKACADDSQAICRLARLDNRIQWEPAIRKHVDRWFKNREQDKLQQWGQAIQGIPETERSRVEVKYRIVNQILQLAGAIKPFKSLFRKKLILPDLRQLFDAIAQDQGAERDLDFPENTDAFRKAIQRTTTVSWTAIWDNFPRGPVPVF